MIEAFDDPPEVKYVHYRWPRYEYKTKDLEYTIQWMVRDGIVLQQCIVTNLGDDEMDVPFTFAESKSLDKCSDTDYGSEQCMKIRDLDYIDPQYHFNDSDDGYDVVYGPNGYSMVLVHELSPARGQDKSASVQAFDRSGTTPNSEIDHSSNSEANNVGGPSSTDIKQESISKDDQGSVATIVSIFLNGNAMDWSDQSSWNQKLGRKGRNAATDDSHNPPLHIMEVITAYKLVYLPVSKAHWKNFLIYPTLADVSGFLRNAPFSPVSLTGIDNLINDNSQKTDYAGGNSTGVTEKKAHNVNTNPSGVPTLAPYDHIEFVVRRNLEQILSVCSIPLKQPLLEQDGIQQKSSVSGEITAVALTCGDISGHRICTSASFFAFQFLISVAKRLKQTASQEPYVCSLLDRISAVCKGHLKWLLEKAEKSESGCFVANYWTTGKMMTQQSGSWLPNNSLTDTSFQLIKAAEYAGIYERDQQFAKDAIQDICHPWLDSLQKSDRRERFAWPHRQEADTNLFRLDDHVWIWKALKSIEDLGIWSSIQGDDRKKLARKFASRDVQREMLRRFTTENDVSRERMLAVSRSSRETRFLFHARDTTLFYGHDWDFFLQQTSFREVWANTVKAQVYHDDNQETGWDNALRYALAVVMGTHNCRINKRSPANLVKSALTVLFHSTSPNGFFPGQLDVATKEPALFYEEPDRDYYYHASFEIPYILLVNAVRINAMCAQASGPSDLDRAEQKLQQNNSKEGPEMTTSQSKRHQIASEPNQAPFPAGNSIPAVQSMAAAQISKAARKAISMKKSNPFNSLIDSTSIVDIDEEWLYNYPSFLLYEMTMSAEEVPELLKTLLDQEDDAAGHVVLDEAKLYLKKLDKALSRPFTPFEGSQWTWGGNNRSRRRYRRMNRLWSRAYVADTQSKRSLGKRKQSSDDDNAFFEVPDNMVLWNTLTTPRTAETAKKRFIWLPKANTETALVCYLCSPEIERAALSLFFDRHANCDKFFFDDTTMYLNTWETEFHLSFYQLLDPHGLLSEGIPRSSEDALPGTQGRKITKASMGFRFLGDFFDRYWTCHFIEYIPAQVAPSDRSDWNFDFSYSRKDRAWRQRKVLELYLFERILKTLVKSTQELFEEIENELGVRQGAFSFSVLSSEDYFSSSAQWQKFQHILQAIEEELESAILTVSRWETREKDRGQEKPRWTRNDERKYRGVIKKLFGSTNRKIRDMQRLHANIRSLKETLISSQVQIRDDLGLRGAENIRFFTYVTVVFLPLGFASSIFSMSGSPEGTVLARMATCAVVALVITVLALINAKTLGVVAEEINFLVDRYSRSTMRRSALIQSHHEKMRKKQEEQAEKETTSLKQLSAETDGTRRRRRPRIESSWHFGFWIAYIFIELPARRVLLAYRALKAHRLSWTTCVPIVLGVVLLPFCIISYLVQILVYNLMDFFMLCRGYVRLNFPSSTLDEDEILPDRMSMLSHPLDTSRPLKFKVEMTEILLKRWKERQAEEAMKTDGSTADDNAKELP
ncbi:hypothetical protein BDV96DRAFT_652751 [Lophiotrema nucula]|uniref:Mg2+ transporter zinc transport protein n=1 Tax=Lophiotrema nucula TaxID=690887 RepID=A0A6A5YN60_9PLEO|nr:hypothetical protein BDV96DRAFT_652751 [Lophiotrema nucula]